MTSTSKTTRYDDDNVANATSQLLPTTTLVSATRKNESNKNNHSILPVEGSAPAIHPANTTCPPGLKVAKSSEIFFHHDDHWMTTMTNTMTTSHSSIPRAIHMISKTKCMTKPFLRNLDRWRFVNHTLYLHDDTDANILFAMNEYWRDIIPDFEKAIRCLPNNGASSASKSDLWRYVLLWQQGGIYTDLDNQPGQHFTKGLVSLLLLEEEEQEPGTTTHDRYDAILVLRHDKDNANRTKPLQSFLLASMHHPLMYLCWKLAVASLLAIPDLALQRAYATTGPHILEQALALFLGLDTTDDDTTTTFADQVRIRPGTFPISNRVFDNDAVANRLRDLFQNRTVTLLTNGMDIPRYIQTSNGIRRAEKLEFYRLAGMTVWQDGSGDDRQGTSCRDWITATKSPVHHPTTGG